MPLLRQLNSRHKTHNLLACCLLFSHSCTSMKHLCADRRSRTQSVMPTQRDFLFEINEMLCRIYVDDWPTHFIIKFSKYLHTAGSISVHSLFSEKKINSIQFNAHADRSNNFVPHMFSKESERDICGERKNCISHDIFVFSRHAELFDIFRAIKKNSEMKPKMFCAIDINCIAIWQLYIAGANRERW